MEFGDRKKQRRRGGLLAIEILVDDRIQRIGVSIITEITFLPAFTVTVLQTTVSVQKARITRFRDARLVKSSRRLRTNIDVVFGAGRTLSDAVIRKANVIIRLVIEILNIAQVSDFASIHGSVF